MGEAGSALRTGLMSAHWNPAGISGADSIQLGAMHAFTTSDSSIEFVGTMIPAGRMGNFALSAVLLRIDPMDRMDYEGNLIGDYIWREWALTGTWGREAFNGLHAGLAVKMIRKEEKDPLLGDSSGTAFAFDTGIIYEPEFLPGLSWGVSVLNSGDGIRMKGSPVKDKLPGVFRTGVSYLYEPVIFSAELARPRGSGWEPGVGAELRYTENLYLRGGYYDREGNISGVTYGAGFQYNILSIDWANLPAGEMLGATRENRFSVVVSFK